MSEDSIVAAGGWCSPTPFWYDILAPAERPYGFPEDHDPWEWIDADDIRRIADVIENGPFVFTEDGGDHYLALPEIRIPRGSLLHSWQQEAWGYYDELRK